MYKHQIFADTHTHTLASTHAYSTLTENVRYAAQIGLKVLAVTDHGPKNKDAPHEWYFRNLKTSVPEVLEGVRVLRGVEANIMDYEGTLDLDDRMLKELEWVVVSYHHCNCTAGTLEQHTNAYLNLAKNPWVDVIGHSGSPDYIYDYETCIKAFREFGKLVEINQHTFHVRKANIKNCAEIAKLCKKHQVPVVVNSDAHFYTQIGDFPDALAMLEEISFPPELVLNSNFDRFAEYLKMRKGIVLK